MQRIAVIFGGRSAEHDISIMTAIASVIKPLELTGKYAVEPIYISKDGVWYWDQQLKDISLYTSGKIEDYIDKAKPVNIVLDGGLTLAKQSGLQRKTTKIDIVFPAMHGTNGEDGALMGLLQMANIPYVGCDMTSSAVAMDKALAKQVAGANGISIVPYELVYKADIANYKTKLKYPLFVKPAHLGSSIGISRVKNAEELANALEVAAHYDNKILIEEEVLHLIEVTLPIMGNHEPVPAMLEKPLTKAEDFFDFDTKYMQGGKKGGGKGKRGAQGYSELPAKLPGTLNKKATETAIATYKALGCEGIARVDMLINSKTGVVYFNEANPLPGDLYKHNWRAAGVSPVDLVQKLVDYALERHHEQQTYTTAFSTNYLKQF